MKIINGFKMEDIIWYLHKFIKPYQYSLLNKKCRKTYFDRYGITLHNYYEEGDADDIYEPWQYEFLASHKIHLVIDWNDDLTEVIYNIECDYDNQELYHQDKQRILNNIISVRSGQQFVSNETLNLISRLPNVKYVRGDLYANTIDNLLQFRKLSQGKKKSLHSG